jgi:hypothetical protein
MLNENGNRWRKKFTKLIGGQWQIVDLQLVA